MVNQSSLTGDSERTASAVANKIGVDEYYSEVLPEDKAAFVEKEHGKGRKVIMIGDGVNDSPALSAADVGIAISDGAQIAREVADITIEADNLFELVALRKISTNLMGRRMDMHVCEFCGNEIDYHEIIDCITCALDARDPYTAGHSERVSDMALKVCQLIGLKNEDTLKIHIAAHLHDIGKIGVPDAVLNKEGKLTDEEFAYIKKHPIIGAEILGKSHKLSELSDIVL